MSTARFQQPDRPATGLTSPTVHAGGFVQNYRVGAVEAVAPGTFAGGVCWAFRAVVVGTCIVAEGGLVTAGVGETVAVGSSGVGALVGVVPSAVGDVVWSVGSVVGDLVGSMTSGVGARVRLVGRRCHGPGAIGRSSGPDGLGRAGGCRHHRR
ncbi:MAG: hypothetical protein WKF57_01110 [Nakamurella sp.]